MPRVLLVHQPIDGGVGRHVTDLANGLAKRNYEVTLCAPARPVGLLDSQLVNHIKIDLARPVTPLADMVALWKLIGVVAETSPDVIHAHSSKAGALTRLARVMRLRTPVVYTPHGYSFASRFAQGIEQRAYREIERALALLASRVVCVCEAEARLARSVGPDSRVRVVYNGIAPAQAGPVDHRMAQLSQVGPVVCAIALLRHEKGLQTLIDAMPGVLAGHPQTQLAIWGDGPTLDDLKAQAARLEVNHAVHFLGLCTDPLAALRGADVFVHPSWSEAFPYVILEAMSVGLPIVASDVGGIGEALTDGKSGLLVPAGQSHPLTRALIDVLGDTELRTSMAEGARDRLEERFTLERMLEGLTGVYGEVSAACRRVA
ncbi:MAG TPA: glycosyltransferase family 4 protein [Solirubrobacteraceae bacterium]|jgi:glycosyltransferase involved in cell wall biosynthesis